MKRRLYLLVPLLLTLSSCSEFTVGYNKERYSAGFSGGASYSMYEKPSSYYYYLGDPIDEESENKVILTFEKVNKDASLVSDVALLNTYVTASEEGFFLSFSNPSYVGTNAEHGIFIGANSSYADGEITMYLAQSVKAAVLYAYSYTYEVAGFETKTYVDQNVAIAINKTGYVPLTSDIDETTGFAKETKCKYKVDPESDVITIKVANARAYINKIVLYY